jgi:hypothetical protein
VARGEGRKCRHAGAASGERALLSKVCPELPGLRERFGADISMAKSGAPSRACMLDGGWFMFCV